VHLGEQFLDATSEVYRLETYSGPSFLDQGIS